MSETKPDCYTYDGRHYLRDRHDDGCEGDCSGCSPCPEDHCTGRSNCGEHVAKGLLTCPKCIGRTRRDLAEIERMYGELPTEAVIQGIDSEAAVLAGPAIDTAEGREYHRHRQESIKAKRIVGELEAVGQHPVTVLGWWDIAFREDYDMPSSLRITVSRAVDYLDRMLDTVAQDPEQDWPTFAGEVYRCRAYLEAVLHDGAQVEKGAPCPRCRDEHEDPNPPALRLFRSNRDHTGASDRWRCHRCDLEQTPAEYRRMVGLDNVKYADKLPMSDLPKRTEVKPGTLRRWAGKQFVGITPDGERMYAPPLLKPCGRSEDGRRLYLVADVEALRDGVSARSA